MTHGTSGEVWLLGRVREQPSSLKEAETEKTALKKNNAAEFLEDAQTVRSGKDALPPVELSAGCAR